MGTAEKTGFSAGVPQGFTPPPRTGMPSSGFPCYIGRQPFSMSQKTKPRTSCSNIGWAACRQGAMQCRRSECPGKGAGTMQSSPDNGACRRGFLSISACRRVIVGLDGDTQGTGQCTSVGWCAVGEVEGRSRRFQSGRSNSDSVASWLDCSSHGTPKHAEDGEEYAFYGSPSPNEGRTRYGSTVAIARFKMLIHLVTGMCFGQARVHSKWFTQAQTPLG